jgi:V/A-type H+-transporting ATPase subunit D
MITYKSAPTRANLIRFKEELKLACEGYELLDRKREALMRELLHLIYEVRRLQEKIANALTQVYEIFRQAEAKLGRERLAHILKYKREEIEVDVLERSVMGIHLPEVQIRGKLSPLYLSPLHTPPELDRAISLLCERLPLFLHYLELKFALLKVATEVKRTERRLKALENIFIPQYKSDILRIESALEENEREEFFRNKRVKTKIVKR